MISNRYARACSRIALALGALWGTQSAQAAGYPDHPITMVVPFEPGGGTDSMARDLARVLGDKLHKSIVVENRGGGGGTVGAVRVARAAPDGYTLLFVTSTFITHAAWEPESPYDPVNGYTPVAMIGRGPLMLVTNKGLGVHSVQELEAAARKAPHGLDYCSAGPGSINHLAGELFRQRTQLPLTHVPYKGSGPATLDFLAGRTQIFFATAPTMLPNVQAGKVDLLAVTTRKRSPLFPDVPTLAEAGVPDVDVSTWWGVVAPPGTPRNVVDALNAAINDVSAGPVITKRLQTEGANPERGTPAEFKKVLGDELAMWKSVVATVNPETRKEKAE
jgi:tripartite-type tricarboxylate transporter receptor subunit TctC